MQPFLDWRTARPHGARLAMATQFSTPTQTQTFTIPKTASPPPLYGPQHPSPTNSASPTSPRMQEYLQHHAPNPYKQLRPLKSPLYVPAVLRPTEHFPDIPKGSPMTPPKSLHGSLDSLQDKDADGALQAAQIQGDLDTFSVDWIEEEDLGQVTGPPTKEHWKVR